MWGPALDRSMRVTDKGSGVQAPCTLAGISANVFALPPPGVNGDLWQRRLAGIGVLAPHDMVAVGNRGGAPAVRYRNELIGWRGEGV